MIRVLTLDEHDQILAGGPELATAGGTRWIDIQDQTPEEIAWLGATFGFHPLALEDCLHLNQRAKFEDYPSAVFLVIHTLAVGAGPSDLTLRELHAFLTGEVLVTVHATALPEVERVWERAAADPELLARKPDVLLYHLCDEVVDAQFPVIEQLRESIDGLEDEVLTGRHERTVLQRIFAAREALVQLRRALSPERDVLLQLSKGADKRVAERTSLYFRDVHDHALRHAEAVDQAREALKDVLAAYHSAAANRTSEIVKRLTLFSAIFLPLTFVTGFFGMNFAHLPFGNDGFLLAALLSMLVLPAGMVVWFWLSRWI
ncbi:magnesium transporter CorA family protein [Vulgatibacter sp.]|uniref:magnesium transporter CorA family protein n=1 Tax=Vulgatibacter sp. TaxID=1971226 RepID=UPI0035672734